MHGKRQLMLQLVWQKLKHEQTRTKKQKQKQSRSSSRSSNTPWVSAG